MLFTLNRSPPPFLHVVASGSKRVVGRHSPGCIGWPSCCTTSRPDYSQSPRSSPWRISSTFLITTSRDVLYVLYAFQDHSLTDSSPVPPEVRSKYATIVDSILEGADLTTITRKSILRGIQERVEYDITPQKVLNPTRAA